MLVELEAARLAALTVGKKYDFLSAWRASTALCDVSCAALTGGGGEVPSHDEAATDADAARGQSRGGGEDDEAPRHPEPTPARRYLCMGGLEQVEGEDSWDALLEGCRGGGHPGGGHPLVALFWAPWCRSCKPLLARMASRAANTVGLQLAAVDAEEEEEIASRCEVYAVPSILIYEAGGRLAQRVSGLDEAALDDLLSSLQGQKPRADSALSSLNLLAT